MRRPTRTAVSHHEAGHVVVAVLLGHPFDRVDIVKVEGDRWGGVHELLHHWDDPNTAEIGLAGPIAERAYAGRWNWRGALSDLEDCHLYGDFVPAEWRQIIASAAQRVSDAWLSIERVAHLLLERSVLTYAEVAAVVSSEESAPPLLSTRAVRSLERRLLTPRGDPP